MHHVLDKEMQGHALLFSGPLELVEKAHEAYAKLKPLYDEAWNNHHSYKGPWFLKHVSAYHKGREAKTWDELRDLMHKPWPQAVSYVEQIAEAVKTGVKEPVSIKRRRRWNDREGDLDVDRFLNGEPEFFRETTRVKLHASRNISLVCNLETVGGCNDSGVYYRSGVAIAIADLLEEAGYTCEVWVWCRGFGVYPAPYGNQFNAYRAKEMGMPVDKHAMCDAMSYWITYNAIFGSFAACPTPAKSIGGGFLPAEDVYDVEKCGIGGWLKHLDITEGCQKVAIPMVWANWNKDGSPNWDNAIAVAKGVLAHITLADEIV